LRASTSSNCSSAIERRPLSGSGEFRTGKTPYETLIVNLRITQGMANVEDVRMEGPNVGLALAGSASIPERDLDLRELRACLRLPRAARLHRHRVALHGAGTLGRPDHIAGPAEPDSALGAAQPILDAIRNRSLRDPVRSAIERLTGAAPAETPPAAAAPALAGSSAPADERPADSGSMPGKADSEPHQDTR